MPYTSGDILLDKYRIEKLLGQGAFGDVYLVMQLRLNALRALKILRRDTPGMSNTGFDNGRARFELEAQLGAQLNSPNPRANLLQIYNIEESGDMLVMEMEYVGGGNLAERIQQYKQRKETFPIALALQIVLDVADGLAVLHEHDIVHRDVKPANILFDDAGCARIADLGLAQISGGASQRSRLSTPHRHPGTPGYMSPEQENSDGYLASASDIYSLGLVLFEVLIGRSSRGLPPGTRASSLRAEIPASLDDLLARMLAKAPEDRPWDGQKTASLLREVLKRIRKQQAAEEQTRLAAQPTAQAQILEKPYLKQSPEALRKPSIFRFWPAGLLAVGVMLATILFGRVFANPAQMTPVITITNKAVMTERLPGSGSEIPPPGTGLPQNTQVTSPRLTNTTSPLIPTVVTNTPGRVPVSIPLMTATPLIIPSPIVLSPKTGGTGQIIYFSGKQGQWDIHAVSESGTVKQIGNSMAQIARIQTSPDGEKIAYISLKNDNLVLIIYNLKTDQSIDISLNGMNASQLAGLEIVWAPDSSQLFVDTRIITLAGETLVDLLEKLQGVLWSPDGTRLGGKLANNQIFVYSLNEKKQKKYSGDSFNWLDDSQILTVNQNLEETLLTLKKVNVISDAQEEVARQGVKRGCTSCGNLWVIQWKNDISPSRGRVLIYRNRQPFFDYLWLDLTQKQPLVNYTAGKVLRWAGWTNNSDSVFFKSPENTLDLGDFPGTVNNLSSINKDNSNVLAVSVSPVSPAFALLTCDSNDSKSTKANCDLTLVDLTGNQPTRKIDSHLYFLKPGLVWSPDGAILAGIVEQDGLPQLMIIKTDGTNQKFLAETASETSLSWVK